jgi:hypothetical protein
VLNIRLLPIGFALRLTLSLLPLLLLLLLLLLLQATLSSKHYMRGERFDPSNPAGLGFSARAATQSSSSSYSMPAAAAAGGPGGPAAATMAGRGRSYSGARAAYGDYQSYPEGRPIFLPEAERFGNPPDLPSLLLQQRVIYISMPVRELCTVCYALCIYASWSGVCSSKKSGSCRLLWCLCVKHEVLLAGGSSSIMHPSIATACHAQALPAVSSHTVYNQQLHHF